MIGKRRRVDEAKSCLLHEILLPSSAPTARASARKVAGTFVWKRVKLRDCKYLCILSTKHKMPKIVGAENYGLGMR